MLCIRISCCKRGKNQIEEKENNFHTINSHLRDFRDQSVFGILNLNVNFKFFLLLLIHIFKQI